MRHRFRRHARSGQWIPLTLLVLMLFLIFLGVAFEFFF